MYFGSTRVARRVLLTTVSAAALAFVVNDQAGAQNVTPAWWGSIEGQYNWVQGDALDIDTSADSLSLEPENGYAGRVHLGGRFGNGWSAAIGLRYGMTDKERDSAYSSFYGSDVEGSYEEDHLVLDLEIGRDVGIGNGGNARVFGGLRFARFDGDGNLSVSGAGGEYYSSFEADTEHRFTGFGPRIGVDAAIPVATNVQVDISAAGAALYGKRKFSVDFSYMSSGGSVSNYGGSESKHVIVPSVEARVALTYLLGQSASVSAGYKAEQFWDIMPAANNFSTSGDNRLIHGPFLELKILGN